jgi:hypothetical protein
MKSQVPYSQKEIHATGQSSNYELVARQLDRSDRCDRQQDTGVSRLSYLCVQAQLSTSLHSGHLVKPDCYSSSRLNISSFDYYFL